MIPKTRAIPRPVLSLLLLLVWLLLNNTLAFGHILLGTVLAVWLPLLTNRFWTKQPDVKKPLLMLRFLGMLVADIAIANLEVARLILGSPKKLRSAFLEVPLDIQGDFPITLLASTISLTPGTVSAQLSADRRRLLVHSLDVEDEAAMIQLIKQRYEKPLKEIYGC
jgi:multicomponent K+:H+ antiporter subunit E